MKKSCPWNTVVFFKQIKDDIENNCELGSNVVNHVKTVEETKLDECRDKIVEYESKLNDGTNWEYYKKIVNPFEIVYTPKKYNNFPESICRLKPLSRSYFKMIEIMDIIHFFKNVDKNISTAHVCEGPGGFIEALLDEALKNECIISKSMAMTLYSDKHNIPGWKRASHFLKKNSNVNIIYGDGTGDIMKVENQQYFIDMSEKSMIFTADGGFDFSYDYMKQEQLIFPLLVASTRIGLEVIKKGGVFILKLIDFYCKGTCDLLYILSVHFEEWTLYKPGMSRPCNPEYYFIGTGFLGCSEQILDMFRLWCNYLEDGKPLGSLYTKEYTPEFTSIIRNLQENSFNSQMEYLERVFYLINQDDDTIIDKYLKNNEKNSYEWCQRFNMPIYNRYLTEV